MTGAILSTHLFTKTIEIISMNFLNISHLPNPRFYLFLSIRIDACFPLILEEVTSLFWFLANSFTCANKFHPLPHNSESPLFFLSLVWLLHTPKHSLPKTNKQNTTIPIFLFPLIERTEDSSIPCPLLTSCSLIHRLQSGLPP